MPPAALAFDGPYVYDQSGVVDGTWRSLFCGPFWPSGEDLGPFWWEAYVCPSATENAYWISGESGGRHPILFGCPGHATFEGEDFACLGGNMADDAGELIPLPAQDDGLRVGEWGHTAIGWNGSVLTTYLNGVPVGKLAYTGKRRTVGTDKNLWIGGSDHSNWKGKIAAVRGVEGFFAHPEGSDPEYAFTPTWPPSPYVENGAWEGRGVQFLLNLIAPGSYGPAVIEDLSPVGFSDGAETKRHPARTAGADARNVLNVGAGVFHRGKFTADPSFPFRRLGVVPVPPPQAPAPAAVPAGALVFDSFSRRTRTLCWYDDATVLGSTEGGSAGALAWSAGEIAAGGTNPRLFGILHGQAVSLSNLPAVLWVTPAAQPRDIRVSRRFTDNSSPRPFGVAFRVTDRSNFFAVYPTGTSRTALKLQVVRYVDGAATALAEWNCPASGWSTLRVTDDGATVRAYCDGTEATQGASGSYPLASSTNATTRGVGLIPALVLAGGKPSAMDRGDDFTVYGSIQ